MEVTKQNFSKILPEIEASIDGCDFLSIDGEFTGLLSGNIINSFDTPSECYEKYRSGSKDFLLIQFGISTFRWDDANESYKHKDFSFYLFPRQTKSSAEKIFSCQSSSIEFLAKHQFDFNKLFYDGISYIDTTEETRLREHLQEKQIAEKELKLSSNDSSSVKNTIPVPENFQARISEICEEVETLLKSDGKKQLEYDNLNGFQRKLIYQELQSKFDKAIFIETKILNNDKRQLVVSHGIDEDEVKKKLEESHAKEWQDLETAVGFSALARKISNSGKLVVGHCMILDILHVLQNFFIPLPESYKDYKLLTSQLFSNLLDTMYMIKSNTFKDLFTSFDLSNMCATLLKKPFKIPKIESEVSDVRVAYSLDDKDYHTAGFDAFITGVSAISLYEYLKTESQNSEQFLSCEKLASNSSLLKPYLNKLFLFKTAYQGSPYINLSGKDPCPSREHVFHITFPTSWTRNDISEIFEPYGGVSFIAFIDGSSAYVSLKQHDQAVFVKTSLCQTNKNYKVTPFWKSKAMIFEQKMRNQIQADSKNNSSTSSQNDIEDSSAINNTKNNLKRKLGAKTSESDTDSKDSAMLGGEGNQGSVVEDRGVRVVKRQRKISQTSAGDFVVSEPKDSRKSNKIQNVFQESDSWE